MNSSENHTRILDIFQRSPVRIMFPLVDGGAPKEAVLLNTAGGDRADCCYPVSIWNAPAA